MLQSLQKSKPAVLLILDGWGSRIDYPGNAIARAKCTNFNRLWHSYPHTYLLNFGPSVGLPQGEVGNSEVGHLNLGAGRIVLQDLLRINLSITDGSFFENEAFLLAVAHAKDENSNIHLMGLVGLGSVHSQSEHLLALLKLVKEQEVEKERVKIHLFCDGRDSPPTSAKNYVTRLDDYINKNNLGQIATVCGRYFAMDRDNRWDRIAKAYFALLGKSQSRFQSPLEAIAESYANGVTDEFINPVVIVDSGNKPVGPVRSNDSLIFINFRPDRARQLTAAFTLEKLENQMTSSGSQVETFDRGPKLENLFFVTMTQYRKDFPVSAIGFKPTYVTMPLARVISERGLRQLHIAETEKYAHVTYFFNGGREKPFVSEDRILVDSPKVASYDLAPAMSTPQIAKKLIDRVESRLYDFIVVNLAGADMVAHTGNFEATVKAVKTIDDYIEIISKVTLSRGGALIVTSDHGNAEEMINEKTGKVDTEHNNNLSPCLFAISDLRGKNMQLKRGILADIAPTILAILAIPKPSGMTGRNLLL